MKKKELIRSIGILLMSAMLLAGCGSSAKDSVFYETSASTADSATGFYDNGYYTDDIYMEKSMAEEAVEEEGEVLSGAEEVKAQDTSRKLIKNVDIEAETEDFDNLLQTITQRTESLGGYVESSRTYNGSHYYGNEERYADITLRVPAEKLDAFLSEVAENSNVISRNESVTDVTLQYVDMKSRKESLETEHERLLVLLEQAETVEDIITIESRLSEVRYEMESMESQLRTLDNQVSYSTVYLYIREVVKYTPVKEQSTWEKITTGFTDSLYDVGKGIQNFAIGLIINLPYLVVWAIVIIAAVLIIKLIRRGSQKRKQKKEEKRLKKEAKKAEKEAAKAAKTEQKEEKVQQGNDAEQK